MCRRYLSGLGLAVLLLSMPLMFAQAQVPTSAPPGTPSTPPGTPPTPPPNSPPNTPAGSTAIPLERPKSLKLLPGRPRPVDPAGRTTVQEEPVIRSVGGASCARRDDLVEIVGQGLDASRNLSLRLMLRSGPIDLEVVAWQGTRLIARLKGDPRLKDGQRYRLRLFTAAGRPAGRAADVYINLCKVVQNATGTPAGPDGTPGLPTSQQPADTVPGELTVLTDSGGNDPAPIVTQLGFGVLQRAQLGALSLVMLRVSLPPGTSFPQALAQLRAALPQATVDANSVYELQAAPRVFARRTIGWPDNSFECVSGGKDVRIGLIDSGVDLEHPALSGQQIVSRSFLEKADLQTSLDHATGIAAILVGKPGAQSGRGLLPAARLFAAGVFRGSPSGKAQTSTLTVARAVNWMAEESVRVVNLSFAGPRNTVLSATLGQAARQGMVPVAAAGNNGPDASPAYPAAEKGLIAVTAVDAAKRLYPSANRGNYIDLAAPGVDVWTAVAGSGGAYRSGTSYAAPYVSAIAAAMLARHPRLPSGLLKESLRRRAVDLGTAGRDSGFGWGLVQVPGHCQK